MLLSNENTYKTPKGVKKIVEEAIDIHTTEVFTQWRKAAFVAMGYNKYGSGRAFAAALAEQNGGETMPGFSRATMSRYWNRWKDHPDTKNEIGEGEVVEFPSDDDWDPTTEPNTSPKAIDMSRASHVEEVVRQIKDAPEVVARVVEALTPAPKPTMKDRRGGEPMETAELVASAGKLWRHTIDQAIAESEDLDRETADYLRETRRYMKMAEKAITKQRFRF